MASGTANLFYVRSVWSLYYQKMKYLGFKIGVICWALAFFSCVGSKTKTEQSNFTKIDSLTETYLVLQDSMLQSWNVMINDENEKNKAMHQLIHMLLSSPEFEKEGLVALEQRLEQLERIRFSQKTISNPHVVEEYDFASNSLISELLSQIESAPDLLTNSKLQSLVDQIKISDQRVALYRSDYDSVASAYNSFLERYKSYLQEIDLNLNQEKRPLFQVALDR